MSKRDQKDFTIPLEEGLENHDEASQRAISRIADLGIDVIIEDRPKAKDGSYFDARLPANVHDFSIGELAELHGLMDRYVNWVSCYVGLAKAELQNKTSKLKLTQARVRKTKLGTKEDKNDETTCDSRYQEVNMEYLEAFEFHHLLENVEAAARRNMSTISRLYESAKVQFEQGRRTGNMGKTSRDRFDRDKKPGSGRRGRGRGKRDG